MFRDGQVCLEHLGGDMTPKPPSGMVRQSLWVSPETLDALKRIGARVDRPIGYLIRKAVEEFVTKQEARNDNS